MPTPATQPLPHVLPSPVPTQSVSPLESFGSIVIEPIELIPKLPDRYSHFGCGAMAFIVRQTPPPAGVIHMRQRWLGMPQFGSIARSVVRPPASYSFGT